MRSKLAERLIQQAADYVEPKPGLPPNAEKTQELHDKIQSGEIDKGPSTEGTVDPDIDLRPKYDGEEAYLIHKAQSNGGHIDVRDLPELRRLLQSSD